MKVTLKNGKDNVVDLDIVIPAKEAADAYNKAASKIAQYVNIDGFRKGKAPRAIVEKHVGTERIKIEAIESLMPKTLSQAIQENNLDVITQPSITSYDFEVGKDLTVNVKVEIRPEVTLGDYKGLNLKVDDSPIPEDAEQKSLDNLLKQHSTMELVVDRPANDTDTAVIDFEGFANGEKIAGGEGKNYALDLGNSNFIPGFAEQIVGKSVNDEFEINEFGEIVRPSLENTENHVSKQSKKIDEELEQWLNGGQSQTPLQKREKEEKTISEAEKLIDQKENDGQSK